ELDLRRKHLGDEFAMASKASLGREIATDAFYGGAVIPDLGALHPGLYHQGLLDRAIAAGGSIIANTAVENVERAGPNALFTVRTSRGSMEARDVFAATNGYSGKALGSLQRRVIPFDAYMIATEELPEETVRSLLPGDRTCL